MRERHLIADAIKLMRELQQIKQAQLAAAIGITKGALSLFESSKTSISYSNILALCEFLGINKEWINGNSEIFLDSSDVLYLYAKNKEMVHKFMSFCKGCSFLHIIIPDTVTKWLISKVLLQEYVVTVVKFENNTFCILKTPSLKSSNDFYTYFESMYKVLEQANISFSYCFLENFADKKRVLKDIETKKITKEELNKLFALAALISTNISLSVDEKRLILKLRELGISSNYFETEQINNFLTYEKGLMRIKEKMNRKEILTKPEIGLIFHLMYHVFNNVQWRSALIPQNQIFLEKLIQIFEYIKNKKFISEKNLVNITHSLKQIFMNEVEMTEKDCEEVCKLLLPWGYYIALSYLNKEREKISSVYFGNLDFLEIEISEFNLTSQDIPEDVYIGDFWVYKPLGTDIDTVKSGESRYVIVFTNSWIDLSLYDLIELILLISNATITNALGWFSLSSDSKGKFTLTKDCCKSRIAFIFSEKELEWLKEIASYFQKHEKFIKLAYRLYVEKYGFV